MKGMKVLGFLVIFMCCSVAVFAVKSSKDVPPWMEDIETEGKSTYLVPRGAKRKVVGAQVIVEPPNEYVARRLYEMDNELRERFTDMGEAQEMLRTKLEGLQEDLKSLRDDFEHLKNDQGIALELQNILTTMEDFKHSIRALEMSIYTDNPAEIPPSP